MLISARKPGTIPSKLTERLRCTLYTLSWVLVAGVESGPLNLERIDHVVDKSGELDLRMMDLKRFHHICFTTLNR